VKRSGSGAWTGSKKLGSLALRVLAVRCAVVVCGRRGKERGFDVPERVLPEQVDQTPLGSFASWALMERVRAAGLPGEEHVRILGPLDPLIWNRELVSRLFDFTYVWEVYKPAGQRRWGYYVCPLLRGSALVGRIDARVVERRLRVDQVWWEEARHPEALDRALDRHARLLGVSR
jgi:hypothetical protein